jgi:hypothetical protein
MRRLDADRNEKNVLRLQELHQSFVRAFAADARLPRHVGEIVANWETGWMADTAFVVKKRAGRSGRIAHRPKVHDSTRKN